MPEKCENQSRGAFPASLFFSHSSAARSTLSTHTAACFRGDSMESEGLLVRSIYYGRIGSEATERLLERFGHDGSFLLRDSETVQGAYCLCVRKAPYVHTYRLIQSTEGWCLLLQHSSGETQPTFRTLETLIECYRQADDVSVAPLTDPLDRTMIQNISSGHEFIYMETCSSSRSVY